MSISDWTTIISGAGGIFLLWQQNQIFKRQNMIFAVQAGQATMQPEPSRLAWLKRYWPTMVTVFLMLLVGYDIYDRHHPGFGYDPTRAWDDSKPLERVYNAHYVNQSVLLDGKHFINSSFDNVTLVYQGTGGFALENSQFSKHNGELTSRLASSNRIVTSALKLSAQLDEINGCKTGVISLPPNDPVGADLPKLPSK